MPDPKDNERHGQEVWKLYSLLREFGSRVDAAVLDRIRHRLIERYIADTLQCADSYYYNKIPEYTLVDKNDIRQAALLGMLDAFDDYDHRCGTTFMQFANAHGHSRIYGAIIDSLRKLQEYPRIIAKYRRELHPKIQQLQQELGRKSSIEDFCERFGTEYRAILQDKLFASGVFNQHVTSNSDEESTSKTSLDALSMMDDFRRSTNTATKQWDAEDRANFQELVLSVISDERERFVVYAYHWLQWNIRTIAKTKLLHCSDSTVLSLLLSGRNKIYSAFTRQELIDRLHFMR